MLLIMQYAVLYMTFCKMQVFCLQIPHLTTTCGAALWATTYPRLNPGWNNKG
jgi:hypothetical protein